MEAQRELSTAFDTFSKDDRGRRGYYIGLGRSPRLRLMSIDEAQRLSAMCRSLLPWAQAPSRRATIALIRPRQCWPGMTPASRPSAQSPAGQLISPDRSSCRLGSLEDCSRAPALPCRRQVGRRQARVDRLRRSALNRADLVRHG